MGLFGCTMVIYTNCLRDVIAEVENNHLLLKSCCCKNHLTGCLDPNLQKMMTEGTTQKGEGALANPRATSDDHEWTPQRSACCCVCQHAGRLPNGSKISPFFSTLIAKLLCTKEAFDQDDRAKVALPFASCAVAKYCCLHSYLSA